MSFFHENFQSFFKDKGPQHYCRFPDIYAESIIHLLLLLFVARLPFRTFWISKKPHQCRIKLKKYFLTRRYSYLSSFYSLLSSFFSLLRQLWLLRFYDICPYTTFAQKTFAQKDVCPERHLPRKTFAQKTFAQRDICPEILFPR
jgi:hypothetical protein